MGSQVDDYVSITIQTAKVQAMQSSLSLLDSIRIEGHLMCAWARWYVEWAPPFDGPGFIMGLNVTAIVRLVSMHMHYLAIVFDLLQLKLNKRHLPWYVQLIMA